MSHQISYNTITVFRRIRSDCLGNIIEMISCFREFYSFKEALPGYIHKLLGFFGNFSDCISTGRIRMISFIDQSCINLYQITILDNFVLRRNSVDHFIIQADAEGARKASIIQKIGNASHGTDHIFANTVDFLGTHSWFDIRDQPVMDFFQKMSGFPHKFNFLCCFY